MERLPGSSRRDLRKRGEVGLTMDFIVSAKMVNQLLKGYPEILQQSLNPHIVFICQRLKPMEYLAPNLAMILASDRIVTLTRRVEA